MNQKLSNSIHAWLVLTKAFQAMGRYVASELLVNGLGESDFRVLEVLLHKGPLPVNIIGPKVDLTPGSISVAVDRLYNKGFVTRSESAEDRRIRIVALTQSGRKLIVRAFEKHTSTLNKIFSELTPGEVGQLEGLMRKVGRRAEALGACGTHD